MLSCLTAEHLTNMSKHDSILLLSSSSSSSSSSSPSPVMVAKTGNDLPKMDGVLSIESLRSSPGAAKSPNVDKTKVKRKLSEATDGTKKKMKTNLKSQDALVVDPTPDAPHGQNSTVEGGQKKNKQKKNKKTKNRDEAGESEELSGIAQGGVKLDKANKDKATKPAGNDARGTGTFGIPVAVASTIESNNDSKNGKKERRDKLKEKERELQELKSAAKEVLRYGEMFTAIAHGKLGKAMQSLKETVAELNNP